MVMASTLIAMILPSSLPPEEERVQLNHVNIFVFVVRCSDSVTCSLAETGGAGQPYSGVSDSIDLM